VRAGPHFLARDGRRITTVRTAGGTLVSRET